MTPAPGSESRTPPRRRCCRRGSRPSPFAPCLPLPLVLTRHTACRPSRCVGEPLDFVVISYVLIYCSNDATAAMFGTYVRVCLRHNHQASPRAGDLRRLRQSDSLARGRRRGEVGERKEDEEEE